MEKCLICWDHHPKKWLEIVKRVLPRFTNSCISIANIVVLTLTIVTWSWFSLILLWSDTKVRDPSRCNITSFYTSRGQTFGPEYTFDRQVADTNKSRQERLCVFLSLSARVSLGERNTWLTIVGLILACRYQAKRFKKYFRNFVFIKFQPINYVEILMCYT